MKKLEQELLNKEQENMALQRAKVKLEADLTQAEEKLEESKRSQEDGEHTRSTNDSLQRKVQLLEDELNTADQTLKDTVEK